MSTVPLRDRPRWQVVLGVWHVAAWIVVVEWALIIGANVASRLVWGVDIVRHTGWAVLLFVVAGISAGFALDLLERSDDV